MDFRKDQKKGQKSLWEKMGRKVGSDEIEKEENYRKPPSNNIEEEKERPKRFGKLRSRMGF